jgi:hypothetical protein
MAGIFNAKQAGIGNIIAVWREGMERKYYYGAGG